MIDSTTVKESKVTDCCNKHFIPAGDLCEDYTPDTGPSITMRSCTNCWYFNDRQSKYKPLKE